MKKFLPLLTALLLVCSMSAALAETPADATSGATPVAFTAPAK